MRGAHVLSGMSNGSKKRCYTSVIAIETDLLVDNAGMYSVGVFFQ